MSAGAQATSAVVRQGHLRKLKSMRKKYFVLRGDSNDCSARLEYYESEKKFRTGAPPRRTLALKSCYNITRRLDLKQKCVIALFTKEDQFCIVADNEKDLQAWLNALLKHHRTEDASAELLHPIQHVWQVSVQKRGLGATKNILGLYNLCLTDKNLTLVKIRSQNNVISEITIPDRVEYALKYIRRCGDSECFFYMEVGRQTTTGAGELWMQCDDSNIAQSMHSTIYHAMRNCAKENENERDHIIMPKNAVEGTNPMPARRQTYSDGRGRAGLSNAPGPCLGACLRRCVCAGAASAASAEDAPAEPDAENQPPNNSLTEQEPKRVIKHHRTVSLPTGCPLFHEPLRIVHERTRSAPLTGDELDRAILEKTTAHSSCKAVNGTDIFAKKAQRRSSLGNRLSKLSPAHSKSPHAATLRGRCDSMPSRACAAVDERTAQRHGDGGGDLDSARDSPDGSLGAMGGAGAGAGAAGGEWPRAPRIPEEPDHDHGDPLARELLITSMRGGSMAAARTWSACSDGGYLSMLPDTGRASASSGSVASGTPSTDPRFSEYQLEPATSHIVELERPPRAYSVGSRPAPRSDAPRHRAYSVGARHRGSAGPHPPHSSGPASSRAPAAPCSAPLLPRTASDDLMELDFSNNSPKTVIANISTSAQSGGFRMPDEYVDMSQRNAGYVEMRPGDGLAKSPPASGSATASGSASATMAVPAPVVDGYVEMNYGRAATRPIAIGAPRVAPPPPVAAASPPEPRRPPPALREPRTPLGSQTLFPLSLESPASPPQEDQQLLFDEETYHHPLTTLREISEEGGRRSPEASSSPSYVKLAPRNLRIRADDAGEPTTTTIATGATVVLAGVGGGTAARFSVSDGPQPPPTPTPGQQQPLNYAALDLEAKPPAAPPAPRAYTQIDFARCDRLLDST